MSQYDEIDLRIFKEIEQRSSPLYSRFCCDEANRLSELTGREAFRIIDGRLQVMRKAGKIVHRTKAESNGLGGWHIVNKNGYP